MKLVEILAKELDAWPTGAAIAVQDGDARKTVKFGSKHANPSIALMGTEDVWQARDWKYTDQSDFDHSALASDWKTAIVTKDQWKSERDRQKGGEWIRNRGKKQESPVAEGVVLEVKFRSGEVETGSDWPRWIHKGNDRDIMQYRVISQPQAEEVEVHTPNAKTVEVMDASDRGEGLTRFENTEHMFTTLGIVDQIDGPIKWRDTVTELNAYIEKFTRERDELIERLASEGFALIGKINSNLDRIDETLDMSDWRNWKAGDVVECTYSDCDNVYTVGNRYDVDHVTSTYARVSDDCGRGSFCRIGDADSVSVRFKLIQ